MKYTRPLLLPKTYFTLHALDSFRDYWQKNEELIETAAKAELELNGPKWIPKNEDESGEFYHEQQLARHLYDYTMAPFFRSASVVMLDAIVEGELRRLVENLEKNLDKSAEGKESDPPMDKIKSLTRNNPTINWGTCKHLQALLDLQLLRDCIAHTRAMPALFNPSRRPKLMKISKRYPGVLISEKTHLHIEAPCIKALLSESRGFFVCKRHRQPPLRA